MTDPDAMENLLNSADTLKSFAGGLMSAAIEDVARVLAAVAGGDLSQKIEAEYLGTIGELKDSVNKTVEQLREVVGQIQRSTDVISAAAGEIEIIPLWPRAGVAAKRVILRAIRNRKTPTVIHPGLVLHEADGAGVLG